MRQSRKRGIRSEAFSAFLTRSLAFGDSMAINPRTARLSGVRLLSSTPSPVIARWLWSLLTHLLPLIHL